MEDSCPGLKDEIVRFTHARRIASRQEFEPKERQVSALNSSHEILLVELKPMCESEVNPQQWRLSLKDCFAVHK